MTLLLLTLSACASQRADLNGSLVPDIERRAQGPQQRAELAAAVEAFDVKDERSLRHLSRIVQGLGSALRPALDTAARKLYGLGQQIGNGTDATAVALLKDALYVVSEASGGKSGEVDRQLDRQRARSALDRSASALKADVPSTEQATAIEVALRAATDVVFLDNGGEPPFGEADRVDAASDGTATEPMSTEQALEQARDAVSKLSQSKWMGSRTATAQALFSLADLIAAVDSKKELVGRIAEVRFQAERLKRTDGSSFGQAGWVRAGLAHALEALQTLQSGSTRPNAPIWLQTAKSSTANIDEGSALTFQRAAIQDAFRASLDAFTAWTIDQGKN